MALLKDDGGNPQDRNNILEEEYQQQFLDVQDMDLSQNLLCDKGFEEESEEIIAVNDTENEILVPESMQVQGLGEGED